MSRSAEMDYNSSEEFSDVSDSGSDFKDRIRARKRGARSVAIGAPPRKQPLRMVTSRVPGTPKTSTPVGNISAVSQVQPLHRSAVQTGYLYEAVESGRSAVVTVVDEWLESYKKDKEAGLVEFMNFIVQCCGCKGVVTREMLNSMQNAEIISRLTKEFNEDSTRYPLSSPGPAWRRFRAGLCEFLHLLVQRCQNSLLYDEYLFSSVLALLTGMSDSQVRAFRHTSTFMAMKLMTALVEVAVDMTARTETMRQRYEAEKSKEPERRAHGRVEELHSIYTELLEQQAELQSMMNTALKGVFVHRYRDRVAEIRALCMEELGVWLKGNPATFLNDGYLKYLGWTMHDKHPIVRRQCMHALQGLYAEKDFAGRLELFTVRFKERMLCMTLDKDSDVAVEAVTLLLLVSRNTEEGLSEADCERLYPLVFTSHRGLACAAGTFLYHRLCSEINKDAQDTRERTVAFHQFLICFFIHTEFHEHAAYLVDSLWQCAGAELRDWESMTSLLLQENGQDVGLEDEEETALIELMMSAMRQAAEGCPPAGRVPLKKVVSRKDQKIQAQDRQRLTNHFILVLPQLLAKYSPDVQKMTSLLRAPLYFNLEIYSSNRRMEKYLDLLLFQLCGIVKKHQADGVLAACARVACVLSSRMYTFSSRADLAVSQLLDDLVDRFTSGLSELLQGPVDEDDVYSMTAILNRIVAFSSAKELTGWQLFEPCLQILKSGVESRQPIRELMVPALKCASNHLLWENLKMMSSPAEAAVQKLKQDVQSLFRVCQACLSVTEAELRDQAFLWLCDMLVVFSVKAVHGNPTLQTLACPPSESLQAEMASFLIDYIFAESDNGQCGDDEEAVLGKITALQRCRNQLAGYCKLVIFGILDLSAASDVFKHYNKFYKDYGDIIKETLSRMKIISPVQSAKTLCLSLRQLYSELPWELGEEEVYASPEFKEMRELARRLAMTFGVDLQRVRKPLASLHKDGIQFSLQGVGNTERLPRNLLFLEILSEFSYKLLPPDRAELSGFLESLAPIPLPPWPPLMLYQRSLQTVARLRTHAQSPQDMPMSKRQRTEQAKRADQEGSLSRVTEQLSLNGSSKLTSPFLTSTARKGEPARSPVARKDPSMALSVSSDELVSEPWSQGDPMESLPPTREALRRHKRPVFLSPGTPSSNSDLDSQLNVLTLIEEEDEEEDDLRIVDLDTLTLPSSKNSVSFLEELFN
ncbi:cohesin subunit SA-3 isoform X2 [Brienomyrus brachyistius]|uniref:cohesin subunit SA-3 isoform X2 n=1 Tax=Brienomyrus brachyistius TaxID=42636 RepID=UPI0020B1E7B7|nr:cohesin subunit SA-3 isoform X2 [Brienomyrus brachyistius]